MNEKKVLSDTNKTVFLCGYHTSPSVWVGDFMLRKDPRNTEAPHINI